VHVFARATDGALAVNYWNGSAWSGWSSLGGVATAAPAVISDGDGRIDVFVRGSDSADASPLVARCDWLELMEPRGRDAGLVRPGRRRAWHGPLRACSHGWEATS
jgi:hypothetical protein